MFTLQPLLLAGVSPFSVRGLNSNADRGNELWCEVVPQSWFKNFRGQNMFIFHHVATLLFTCVTIKDGFIKLDKHLGGCAKAQ